MTGSYWARQGASLAVVLAVVLLGTAIATRVIKWRGWSDRHLWIVQIVLALIAFRIADHLFGT